jgi:hypothetical protein
LFVFTPDSHDYFGPFANVKAALVWATRNQISALEIGPHPTSEGVVIHKPFERAADATTNPKLVGDAMSKETMPARAHGARDAKRV